MFVLCVVSKDQERQNAGQSRQKQVPMKYRVQENTKKKVPPDTCNFFSLTVMCCCG